MNSLLSGNNPADRLVEVLAGSTALLSDPLQTTSGLPLSPAALTADDADQATDQSAAGVGNTLSTAALDPVTSMTDAPLGGDGSALPLAGPDGALQPILNAENTLVLDVHSELEVSSHETGTAFIVHGVTDLGETIGLGRTGTTTFPDGHTNLLTDVLNAPGSILDGGLTDTAAHLGADLSDVINGVSALKDAVIFGTDPSNPVPEIISGLGSDLQNTPLLTINGGNNDNDGGLLGGVVGDISGSSSGHLVDVDAGPQQQNGLTLDVLSQPQSGPGHTVEVNAVDVGPTGPHLADLGLLTGADAINIPALSGAGTDSLAGNLLGGTHLPAAATSVPAMTPVDVGALHDATPGLLAVDHGVLDLHGTHII